MASFFLQMRQDEGLKEERAQKYVSESITLHNLSEKEWTKKVMIAWNLFHWLYGHWHCILFKSEEFIFQAIVCNWYVLKTIGILCHGTIHKSTLLCCDTVQQCVVSWIIGLFCCLQTFTGWLNILYSVRYV